MRPRGRRARRLVEEGGRRGPVNPLKYGPADPHVDGAERGRGDRGPAGRRQRHLRGLPRRDPRWLTRWTTRPSHCRAGEPWTAQKASRSPCSAGSTRSRPPMGRLRRCGAGRARARSLHHPPLPARPRELRLGRARLGLDAAASRRAARGRGDRGDAALRQEPQPGRVHLRPGLGARLGARRRQLLPEAPGRGALHPGDRPPLPDPAGPRGRRAGPRCSRAR